MLAIANAQGRGLVALHSFYIAIANVTYMFAKSALCERRDQRKREGQIVARGTGQVQAFGI